MYGDLINGVNGVFGNIHIHTHPSKMCYVHNLITLCKESLIWLYKKYIGQR